jgi:hypothetical protein
MKTSIITLSTGLLLLLTLQACNFFSSSSGPVGPVGVNATGIAYEIVVVADPTLWKDAVGDKIKEELLAPVPGLPQDEPSMRITYVYPADFNGMMTYVRNILVVNVDASKYTKVSFRTEKDVWANGQVVIYLSAPDRAMLTEYLSQHPGQMVDYFTKTEMMRMAGVLRKTHSTMVHDKLNAKFGITLHVPSDFKSWKDTTQFFWASNDANTGRTDLVVYTFPYTDANTFTKEYLIAKRDSILGAYIPGAFPNSRMATDASTVIYTPVTLQDKYCGILRGLWHVEGDMMGGPFVSYARLDEANGRIIVTEGFVYAPETSKSKYIRRMEAALQTLRLPGENTQEKEN